MNLPNDWYVLLIFWENELLVVLKFAIVSFISFSFISALIFILLPVHYFFSVFFLTVFRCKGSCFVLFCLMLPLSLDIALYCYDSPSLHGITEAHRFWVVVFSFFFIHMHMFTSFMISSVTCWLFRCMLFTVNLCILHCLIDI